MKYIMIIICLIMVTGCSRQVTFKQLEAEYGKLTPYTPKSTFVHFITKDSVQIDLIKTINKGDTVYIFLSKEHIK